MCEYISFKGSHNNFIAHHYFEHMDTKKGFIKRKSQNEPLNDVDQVPLQCFQSVVKDKIAPFFI